MTLNTYIELLGRAMREVESLEGPRLVSADGDAADLVVASADYVITLSPTASCRRTTRCASSMSSSGRATKEWR